MRRITRRQFTSLAGLVLAAVSLVCLSGTDAPSAQAAAPESPARPSEEPLAQQARAALDRGVQYLKAQARERGHWDHSPDALAFPGGYTSLALLALLN